MIKYVPFFLVCFKLSTAYTQLHSFINVQVNEREIKSKKRNQRENQKKHNGCICETPSKWKNGWRSWIARETEPKDNWLKCGLFLCSLNRYVQLNTTVNLELSQQMSQWCHQDAQYRPRCTWRSDRLVLAMLHRRRLLTWIMINQISSFGDFMTSTTWMHSRLLCAQLLP